MCGDTTINTNNYKKIYFKHDVEYKTNQLGSTWDTYALPDPVNGFNLDTSFMYVGALRDISQQVLFVALDSINEYLLYDFNLTLTDSGPTVIDGLPGLIPYYAGPGFSINSMAQTVNSTSTVVTNDALTRDVWGWSPISMSAFQWIEGIGSTASLLLPYNSQIDHYYYELNSFQVDGVLIYSHTPTPYISSDPYIGNYVPSWPTAYTKCFTNVLNVSLEEDTVFEIDLGQLFIYPNPNNTGVFNIKYSGEIQEVKMYDMIGRDLKINIDLSHGVINAKNIAGGKYIIELLTAKGTSVQEVFIIK